MSTIIGGIQKIVVCETFARLFIIGSNTCETCFRIIKIDRTEPKDLVLIDDRVKYNKKEITELLGRINGGKKRYSQPSNRISSYGIVGFVRFLDGYYLILITKRRKIAQIAHHNIYKIVDTQMIYIPNNREKSSSEESKYLRMFQNVDLSSNFYFSYSYDLTHTLQYNLSSLNSGHHVVKLPDQTVWEGKLLIESGPSLDQELIRTNPNWKFVWNEHLLKPANLHPEWLLFITHGFVGQSDICVFGKPIYLTLIARRSKKFAGTRFLKRGANLEGSVANEVETEQIVFDASVSSFNSSRFTSFVQMRGSIPSHWSQDSFKVVPKPAIQLDFVDPYYRTAGIHFNELFCRYGSPIIVLNLVKKRERKPHESVLTKEIKQTIAYLNQFLPQEHHIIYFGLDMARMNKLKDVSVMGQLSDIGYRMLKLTNLFIHNIPKMAASSCTDNKRLGFFTTPSGQVFQTGVVRVNCVDCLDRTNTAQFALGKCALAYQLYLLGVMDKPFLEFDTDAVRMLEEIYEDHGDTLALQYGGSQLVHRIKTYRKIAPLTSHSRDFMQTLSRYYSNTFSDADKQNAINLFLGVFNPRENIPPIWELETDFYLHNEKAILRFFSKELFSKSLTCWFEDEVALCLPRAAMEIFKGKSEKILYSPLSHDPDMMTDGFSEQYRPQELTLLANHLLFEISHSERHFVPNCSIVNEHSPFCVRHKFGKRKESISSGSKSLQPNPSVSGHVSSSSNSDSESESDSYLSDDALSIYSDHYSASSIESDFSQDREYSPEPFFDLRYGSIFNPPKNEDYKLYQDYVAGTKNSSDFTQIEQTDHYDSGLIEEKVVKTHTSQLMMDYKISETSFSSISLYEDYVDRGHKGPQVPSPKSLKLYYDYCKFYCPTEA